MGLKRTPHPPSYLGHPLPKGEGRCFDFYPSPVGEDRRFDFHPSPRGEGGPRPAFSPAGAGRVRGLFAGDPFIALEVCVIRDFDGTVSV